MASQIKKQLIAAETADQGAHPQQPQVDGVFSVASHGRDNDDDGLAFKKGPNQHQRVNQITVVGDEGIDKLFHANPVFCLIMAPSLASRTEKQSVVSQEEKFLSAP
jgi:hypothetical protein